MAATFDPYNRTRHLAVCGHANVLKDSEVTEHAAEMQQLSPLQPASTGRVDRIVDCSKGGELQ